MARTGTILARPTSVSTRPEALRRGDLTPAERENLVFYLEDYAEMLETCAMGLDIETDADTMKRVRGARDLAERFRRMPRC